MSSGWLEWSGIDPQTEASVMCRIPAALNKALFYSDRCLV